ncbi:hypothetical protein LCGC14_1353960 [marine sediment metagenome]|uniref:ATP-dependent Clp protease proteolytic subunit n=1 Tax=marine sediment metagenome TaxID=412755 RepID=A0A0F9NCB5_9ZZZZ
MPKEKPQELSLQLRENDLIAAIESKRALAKRDAAEALKFKAETRKENAEAAGLEVVAAITEIERDQARRKDKENLAADKHNFVYVFDDPVHATSVRVCIAQLTVWTRNNPKQDIEIIFNSPGGDVVEGMALYDFIQLVKGRGHHVTTTALGMAASMAGILLQAGTKRRMGAEAWVLIHEGSFGTAGKVGEVEDKVDWVKRIMKRICKIFAARSTLSAGQIARRWKRKDWWLDSSECLKFGFIDEILPGV